MCHPMTVLYHWLRVGNMKLKPNIGIVAVVVASNRYRSLPCLSSEIIHRDLRDLGSTGRENSRLKIVLSIG